MMFLVFGLVFGWTVWAAMLWGAIRIIDRHNAKNTFTMALVFAPLQMIVAASGMFLGLMAAAAFVLWLVFLMRLFLSYYNLTLGPALLVLLLLLAAPFGLQFGIEALHAISPVLAMLVVLATPVAIMSTWLYVKLRAPRDRSSVPAEPSAIPVARVVSKPRREPTAPQRIVPIATNAPERERARDPEAPDEPSMLR